MCKKIWDFASVIKKRWRCLYILAHTFIHSVFQNSFTVRFSSEVVIRLHLILNMLLCYLLNHTVANSLVFCTTLCYPKHSVYLKVTSTACSCCTHILLSANITSNRYQSPVPTNWYGLNVYAHLGRQHVDVGHGSALRLDPVHYVDADEDRQTAPDQPVVP